MCVCECVCVSVRESPCFRGSLKEPCLPAMLCYAMLCYTTQPQLFLLAFPLLDKDILLQSTNKSWEVQACTNNDSLLLVGEHSFPFFCHSFPGHRKKEGEGGGGGLMVNICPVCERTRMFPATAAYKGLTTRCFHNATHVCYACALQSHESPYRYYTSAPTLNAQRQAKRFLTQNCKGLHFHY